MKSQPANSALSAFTLIELLVVIAIVAVLAVMLLPARTDPKRDSDTDCRRHLRQIDIAFTLYAADNGNRYPMQFTRERGGAMEPMGNSRACVSFQMLRTEWPGQQAPGFLVCPLDKTRTIAANIGSVADSNISYFLDADAQATNRPADTVLAGDRDLNINGQQAKPGIVTITTNQDIDWSGELHSQGGNVAYADGHVEMVKMRQLNAAFIRGPASTNRLLVP